MWYFVTDEANLTGLTNLTYASGTQSFGPGSQMCVNISIIDDHLVERAETFVVCGCPTPLAIIPEASGCTTVTIEDNDGKINMQRTQYRLGNVHIIMS